MKRRAGVATPVLMIVLFTLLASAASATVSKSGYKYCSGYIPYSQSLSTGTTDHYPPGNGFKRFINGGQMLTRKAYSTSGDGFWFVETDGVLSNSGTFAGCSAYKY